MQSTCASDKYADMQMKRDMLIIPGTAYSHSSNEYVRINAGMSLLRVLRI